MALFGMNTRSEIEVRGRRRIFTGLFFSFLALGQLVFACFFAFYVRIVSQTEWWTIEWRWILPWIALASFFVFAVKAWKAFAPG